MPLGRRRMPEDGHLSWTTVYRPGKVVAEGYRSGRRILREVVETTGPAARLEASTETIGQLAIVTIKVLDAKGRVVPNACPLISLELEGDGRILGAGNGDPAYRGKETSADGKTMSIPAFNGLLQLLVQKNGASVWLRLSSDELKKFVPGFVAL